MPPILWPAWLQQWFDAFLEILACSGVPWQAATVIAGAIGGMFLLAVSSMKGP